MNTGQAAGLGRVAAAGELVRKLAEEARQKLLSFAPSEARRWERPEGRIGRKTQGTQGL
jgi:hypothetical protein